MRIPQAILFTKEGYEALQKEQKDLKYTRKAAVEDLAKARAMGDLSENGYYKSARAKLSSVDRRIREVAYLLKFGKVKETVSNGLVDIGSTVVIKTDGNERSFLIVGGYESNPSEGKLSHISPLGKALIGMGKGDTVTIATQSGTTIYTIISIS